MKARLFTSATTAAPGSNRDRERQGMALIVTLVLLAVITFMAVAFLVISRSEKGAVTTNTDQTLTRFAVDAARERAIAQIMATVLASTNPQSASLLVPTNYINPAGFVSGDPSLRNVSYTYANGAPLSQPDLIRNLQNLQYDPRPPVFVVTNRQTGASDFRFYYDLNRNGQYEPSGLVPAVIPQGGVQNDTPRAFMIGDPEWIGGLQTPDRPHAGDNPFLFRYTYIAIPSSQTLDLNYIHNYARNFSDPTMTSGDGFTRNQGVGSWEINLAAFLVDLNTNLWLVPPPSGMGSSYFYNTENLSMPNAGAAFDDAVSLLRYRYDANVRNTLWSPGRLYPANGTFTFENDMIDTYASGPIMNGVANYTQDPDRDRINAPWPGAYSTNHYFSTQDLFDRAKTAKGLAPGVVSFSDRLLSAGSQPDPYNRYTFYRLLSQLGTDSDPVQNKIHLNYRNMDDAGNISMAMVTNYQAWSPIQFFTNVANRMLAQAGYKFDVGSIQLFPTNYYTPSVHRILQMAANIYDATTSTPYPSVFRPRIESIPLLGTNAVFITGYEEELGTGFLTQPWRDLNNPIDRQNIGPNNMVIGVPTVIGAKKGLPNFNQFEMDTQVQMTRKLEFRRDGGAAIVETNQMYLLMISNSFGLEAWNSYRRAYPRDLTLSVVVNMGARITNENGTILLARSVTNTLAAQSIGANSWKGFSDKQHARTDGSLIKPFEPGRNDFLFLTNSIWLENLQELVPLANRGFERLGSRFPLPRWWLTLRTQVRFILIDSQSGRVIDFVNLDNQGETYYLTEILTRNSAETVRSLPDQLRQISNVQAGDFWLTNRVGGGTSDSKLPLGMLYQIMVSAGSPQYSSTLFPNNATNRDAMTFFKDQLGSPKFPVNVFYAPFAPTRDLHLYTRWQVNDPLVHYHLGDLTDMVASNRLGFVRSTTITNIGDLNSRYQPWDTSYPSKSDLAMQDPLVTRSDDWNFPTNKFPSVGWLGRVHRGTPWQTIYLKAANANPESWMKYAGNGLMVTNYGQLDTNMVPLFARIDDTAMSRPTNDWPLLDIFTTAINENGMRGQLSINQTNLAAWSAVLSGVNVLPDLSTNTFIQPAGIFDPADPTPVARIVDAINRTRANRPDKAFHHLADIASVPELTVRSPYLSGNPFLMNDEVYERIPQQILGLLHCDDTLRYVIYAYGQALKPANKSVLPSSGLCTNYQVTAEIATRSVVRVEGAPKNPRVIVESFNILPPD